MKNFVLRINSFLDREVKSLFYKFFKPSFKEDLQFYKKFGYTNSNDFINSTCKILGIKNHSDNTNISDYFCKNFPDEALKIISKADEFIEKNINIHNFVYSDSKKINWHKDPLSNTDIRIQYWRHYRFNTNSEFPDKSPDPILLFKLHTHQHMVRYAQAYLISNNKKYLYKLIDEMKDWINCFPPGFGYPYLISLNVSQRLITWCFIFSMLKDDCYFQKNFLSIFIQSIEQQTIFLSKNLSKFGLTNNFLLSELVAIKFVYSTFPFLKKDKASSRDLDNLLSLELDKQICSDGSSFENSTGYQRFVTELLVILCIINEETSQKDITYVNYLNGLALSLAKVSSPGGYMPHIGDVSLERAYWFETEEDILNINDLIAISCTLTNSSILKYYSFSKTPSLFWLLGEKGIKRFNLLELVAPIERLNIFPEGGFGSMRSSLLDDDSMHVSFDCGDIGLNGEGGHGHNDFGSFSMSYKKRAIVLDRGTYTYFLSSKSRNEYRSSLSHNMPIVNSLEMSPLGKNLFSIQNIIDAKINQSFSSEDFSFIDLSHSGYMRLNNPTECKRKIALTKNNMLFIEDTIKGYEKKSLEWNLYLDPNIQVAQKSKSEVILKSNHEDLLSLGVFSNSPLTINNIKTTYSPSYGLELPTTKLTIRYDFSGNQDILFIFKPCDVLHESNYNRDIYNKLKKYFKTTLTI